MAHDTHDRIVVSLLADGAARLTSQTRRRTSKNSEDEGRHNDDADDDNNEGNHSAASKSSRVNLNQLDQLPAIDSPEAINVSAIRTIQKPLVSVCLCLSVSFCLCLCLSIYVCVCLRVSFNLPVSADNCDDDHYGDMMIISDGLPPALASFSGFLVSLSSVHLA